MITALSTLFLIITSWLRTQWPSPILLSSLLVFFLGVRSKNGRPFAHGFFFVCWRFKRPFFFCKAHDYWRTWAAGKHGTQNNAISFWNKSTLSSKFGVIFDVDTIFFSRLFDSVNENLLIGDTRMKETIGIRHVWICLCRLYIPRILFANQYRHITRRT